MPNQVDLDCRCTWALQKSAVATEYFPRLVSCLRNKSRAHSDDCCVGVGAVTNEEAATSRTYNQGELALGKQEENTMDAKYENGQGVADSVGVQSCATTRTSVASMSCIKLAIVKSSAVTRRRLDTTRSDRDWIKYDGSACADTTGVAFAFIFLTASAGPVEQDVVTFSCESAAHPTTVSTILRQFGCWAGTT